MPGVCFGSWTTVRSMAGKRRWSAYVSDILSSTRATGPRAHTRKLAQPGRDLFFDPAEKGPHAERLPDLDVLAERLLDFQYHWELRAQPFDWKFIRDDLKQL